MSEYNGHKNYNHWNVSLWLMNDEGLYRLTMQMLRHARNKDDAARRIVDELRMAGIDTTPDGVRYTVTRVRAALVGL